MFRLFIDESGDTGRYRDDDNQIIKGSSKFFTLAGIIVNENEESKLNKTIEELIDKYLSSIYLPAKFKLHYHPLKHNLYPYDHLSSAQRNNLIDDVFAIIRESTCTLLSVTINLDYHYQRYIKPANPTAYALLIIQERFQDFLEENKDVGETIYERFNKKARKKAQYTMKELQKWLKFRHYRKLDNIRGHIKNGDPNISPVLQLADFFAHVTWMKSTINNSQQRWNSISHKYFRLNKGWYKSGNVQI